MSGPVEEVHGGRGAFGEVMMVHHLTTPPVHVFDSYIDPQGSCQGADVDVVTFTIHGVHFLEQARERGERGVIFF